MKMRGARQGEEASEMKRTDGKRMLHEKNERVHGVCVCRYVKRPARRTRRWDVSGAAQSRLSASASRRARMLARRLVAEAEAEA
jgi:hypothetical protein